MSDPQNAALPRAKKILASAAGVRLSGEERVAKTVDLATAMMEESLQLRNTSEKQIQKELAGMMKDPRGKSFLTALTDQYFRTNRSSRAADQLKYLLGKFGIPKYLSWDKKVGLKVFKWFGKILPWIMVPVTRKMIRSETAHVILPGKPADLSEHLVKRRSEGIRLNLNHLGEAILGEQEALERLNLYLQDLERPDIDYVSVKISSIFSQLNLLSWDDTLEVLAERLRSLYRAAMKNQYTAPDGSKREKFVNLDMEEYRDLDMTVSLFCKVLSEPEFLNYSAGIVLQSYLPDSYRLQEQITSWARDRVERGGAPVKLRIVKGANLAMEHVEASIMGWPPAPYGCKCDVDANFKKMVGYGCQSRNAEAVHLGIGSHNIFDIAYALLLRAENGVEDLVEFEMLEGMADHIRRTVQKLSGKLLLYCPVAEEKDFPSAISYLVRRLDENTGPDNFLRSSFELQIGSHDWKKQEMMFSNACLGIAEINSEPLRNQNRQKEPLNPDMQSSFENEPDTDWSLASNREWANQIIAEWKARKQVHIPLVIGGVTQHDEAKEQQGYDPSVPGAVPYTYTMASPEQTEQCLQTAFEGRGKWASLTPEQRSPILARIAQGLRKKRNALIGAMVVDTGKTVPEGDVEVSEAIDFAEYYRRNAEEVGCLQDIKWVPKGTALVAPPWNFPCSISAGGILAALAAGSTVIYKPPLESILVGWELAQICWEAGVPKEVLQFITGLDETVGTALVQDSRVDMVILTGATQTARHLMSLRPGIDLMAETGGKNTIIATSMADRDLAIKCIVQSAFGHSGQKCSACSVLILEDELYRDKRFLESLKSAAASLKVGSAWDFSTKIPPLIHPPQNPLLKALTTLEPGESWLLEPHPSPDNPYLWHPGIKLGVKPESPTFQKELFGPLLAVVRADNFLHAIDTANSTPYGLTAGLQSLDEREQALWLDNIVAGNLYINRAITGSIVQRQPFGGCKDSCYSPGAKTGGPNYVMQLMRVEQTGLPEQQETISEEVYAISRFFENQAEDPEQLQEWDASLGSYAYFWTNYFSKAHDPSLLIGQDNFLKYIPHDHMAFRANVSDSTYNILRVAAAATTCKAPIQISASPEQIAKIQGEWEELVPCISLIPESNEKFAERIKAKEIRRVRMLQKPDEAMLSAMVKAGCITLIWPVLSNGRVELLNYLREVSISHDYHRYGNLGTRENERRSKP